MEPIGVYVMLILAAVGFAAFWIAAVFGGLVLFDFLASKLKRR